MVKILLNPPKAKRCLKKRDLMVMFCFVMVIHTEVSFLMISQLKTMKLNAFSVTLTRQSSLCGFQHPPKKRWVVYFQNPSMQAVYTNMKTCYTTTINTLVFVLYIYIYYISLCIYTQYYIYLCIHMHYILTSLPNHIMHLRCTKAIGRNRFELLELRRQPVVRKPIG